MATKSAHGFYSYPTGSTQRKGVGNPTTKKGVTGRSVGVSLTKGRMKVRAGSGSSAVKGTRVSVAGVRQGRLK